MAYVCVADIANPATSAVIAIFNYPQNNPASSGYIGYIDDSDSRIAIYNASQISNQMRP